jgi:arylsulfatase A-like enzyme
MALVTDAVGKSGVLDRYGRRILNWLTQTVFVPVRRARMGIVLLPWLVALVAIIMAKKSLLVHAPSPLLNEIELGLRNPPSIHFWERVALFRADLLWYFFLGPLLFTLLTFRLPVRWRMVAAIGAAFFFETIAYAETIVFFITGTFSSVTMMWVSVAWALRSHTTAFFTLPGITVFKISAMSVLVALASLVALIGMRNDSRWLNRASLSVFGVASVAALVSWIPNVPPMPWTTTLVQMTIDPALLEGSVSPFHSGNVPALLQAYRASARVPVHLPTVYTGQAKGYNVILFVLEATTAQSFDPARDSLTDMPNIRRLREHSFLMGSHYTSYPLTNAAAFSIFTSLYQKMPSGEEVRRHIVIPGLISNLRAAGYDSGYYGYVWKIPAQRDDLMLASFGFDRIVAPEIDPKLDEEGNSTFYGPVDYAESHDIQALQSLRSQIHSWTASKQKFVAAFFPEMGHDPYRELYGHHSKSELERGHQLAVHQDAWLGQLIDELERDGSLDHTIIVLTADHGMRFESVQNGAGLPLLPHGKVKDVTMRVPMLIYAPGVVPHPVEINYPTSHIDITPTLLDLLGVSTGADLEQGSSIFSPGIENRRLFLAMNFFGASGYYDLGSYYSSGPLGVVYKSPTLNFTDKDALRFDDKEAQNARAVLAEHDARQRVILSNVLRGEDH